MTYEEIFELGVEIITRGQGLGLNLDLWSVGFSRCFEMGIDGRFQFIAVA